MQTLNIDIFINDVILVHTYFMYNYPVYID